ncbi:MAG: UMP kinase [Thermoplasmata archaeon]|nr:UMP kinase [Thermoplasmata archaeon]
METVVISVGGSVILRGADYIKALAGVINEAAKTHRIAITVGGGKIAREYISLGRELGGDETTLDEFGISVTRLNARLLTLAIPNAYPAIPEKLEDAYRFFRAGWIVVMGGTTPGHTTDAVAAMLAEKLRAEKLVNVTNVDGLYDKDPRKHPDATKIEQCSHDELIKMLTEAEASAGQNHVFDLLGAKILRRAKIKLLIVNGENLEHLRDAIAGREPEGRWSQIG